MPSPHKVALFFQTLTPEILGTTDYTNWQGIEEKVRVIRREIALVQSLDKTNPEQDLADLLERQPLVLKVLQLLIAHTPEKIYFNEKSKTIDFKADLALLTEKTEAGKTRSRAIAATFVEMGLVDFLKGVRSVEDVVKGVLVGLEPNVRKNRRGAKLEVELNILISSTVEKINREEGTALAFERQMYVDLVGEKKKFDYVVLDGGEPKVGIEVNFYSVSGSKPSEVLGRAYPHVQQKANERHLGFVVITDGAGWESMRPVIAAAHEKLKCVMNIQQAQAGGLEAAVKEFLFRDSGDHLKKAA